MLEIHAKEIKELTQKLKAVEKFANELPLFADYIIANRLSADRDHHRFGNSYKQIPLEWGINRSDFRNDCGRDLTNSDKTYDGYLFTIYINTCNLFDEAYSNFGLFKAIPNDVIYYCDTVNSTFYIEDGHIESFLDHLNTWYLKASKECQRKRKRDKVKELEDEIKRLKEAN